MFTALYIAFTGPSMRRVPTPQRRRRNLKTRLEKEIAAGTWKPPRKRKPPEKPLTFAEFCDLFLADKEGEGRKPSTLDDYKSVINKHLVPFLGKDSLSDIGPARVTQLMRHLNKQGVSPALRGKILRYARAILRHGMPLEYVQADPCRAVRAPEVEKKAIHPLTPEEVEKLLGAADSYLRPLFAVACYAGLRQGEILALRWQDIDFDNNLIHVTRSLMQGREFTTPKTASSIRRVPLIGTLKAILKDYRPPKVAPSSLIFPNRDGGPLDKSNLLQRKLAVVKEGEDKYNPKKPAKDKPKKVSRFEAILNKAGLPQIRFHDLRHTYASLSILAGVDLKTLQACMGHSSIAVTANIYSHLYTDSYDRAGIALENLVGGGRKGGPTCRWKVRLTEIMLGYCWVLKKGTLLKKQSRPAVMFSDLQHDW